MCDVHDDICEMAVSINGNVNSISWLCIFDSFSLLPSFDERKSCDILSDVKHKAIFVWSQIDHIIFSTKKLSLEKNSKCKSNWARSHVSWARLANKSACAISSFPFNWCNKKTHFLIALALWYFHVCTANHRTILQSENTIIRHSAQTRPERRTEYIDGAFGSALFRMS